MHILTPFLALLIFVSITGCKSTPPAASTERVPAEVPTPWVAGWVASSQMPFENIRFDHQTVRMVIRSQVSGSAIRLRFSNQYGQAPLAISAVRVGSLDKEDRIVTNSDLPVNFHGRPHVTVPPGEMITSDEVSFALEARTNLVVSVYISEPIDGETVHMESLQDSYVSKPGDYTGWTQMPGASVHTHWYFLNELLVAHTKTPQVVVGFGDSLTDGTGSTSGLNHRWTDFLSARLATRAPTQEWAVLNSGIWGNRLLHDGIDPKFRDVPGISGLSRFDEDALEVPGVRFIIVLLGTNDIGQPGEGKHSNEEAVAAEQITTAYSELAQRAHAQKSKILIGTVPPFGGALHGFYTKEKETVRQQVNAWIRGPGAAQFEGVVDFDEALRDPSEPTRLRGIFDHGDHLHLTDAGYQAMANAVNLDLLIPRPPVKGGKK